MKSILFFGLIMMPLWPVFSQIDKADFSDLSDMVLHGSAQQSGTELRVTNFGVGQLGVAWYDTPQPVSAGFDTTFDFRITPGPFVAGEGLVFVIQDAPQGTGAVGGEPLGWDTTQS